MNSGGKKSPIPDETAMAVLDSCRQLVSLVHTASRASEKQLGLSAAQLYVLQKMRAIDTAVSIGDLAVLTRTHQSSVSVVVKKLVLKKLLVSRPAPLDARKLELRVTDKGKKTLENAPEAVQDRLIRAIKTLSSEDGQALHALLQTVLEKAEGLSHPVRLFLEDEGSI
ncbi:MAG: MarR family transcriptional regulator [Chitinophagaceae bacterium]|nr:MarR family transcriptional regulator [Oligoflexus sp.]